MLQNWPIRTKLVVILVVPLVALAVLSALQVRGNVASVRASQQTKALATFSVEVNRLISAIQTERFASHGIVSAGPVPPLPQQLQTGRAAVDKEIVAFHQSEAKLPSDARQVLQDGLASVDDKLGRLKAQRQLVDGRTIDIERNTAYFDPLIADLLSLDAGVAQGSSDSSLVYGAGTLVAISQAKEAFAQVSGAVNRVALLNDSSAVLLVPKYAGQQQAWLAQYQATSTASEKAALTKALGVESDPKSLAAQVATMRDQIVRAKIGGGSIPLPTAIQWVQLGQKEIAQLQTVEVTVSNDLVTEAERISSQKTKNSIVSSLIVALVLAISILISLLVASPMIRQLRKLREGALEVADHRLPEVVERLHRGEAVDLSTETFPVPAATRDEIGQLAEAFGTVHEVAVRVAVEQAAMRKSIGDTFLNLARRSQALIHRQLKVIDALERKETDPDELEELFRLDHLATRMRRHAEDLIVLSGSKPARGWRRPVPIKDVIRGAVAEVEDYTRVKVLPVGGGSISGHAVGDVIHMLAELIENATSFSPPHTPVHVTGHEVSNGFAIEIEDRGLGMSPQEFKALNDRLENPPPFDLTTSERLGLFVVGRLAERHAIKVRLRTSPYGGTMAIVLIPGTLLRANDDEEPNPALSGGDDGDGRELASVGAAARASAALDTESLDVGATSAPLVLPAGGSPGLLPEPDVLTGPASGALAMPAGALDPDDLPAPPPMTDPVPPVPPALPSDDTGPRVLFGAPPHQAKADDEPLIDDLPVFATVRSSWFIADRPRRVAPPGGDPLGTASPRPDLSDPASGYSTSVTPPRHENPVSNTGRYDGDLPTRTSPRHQSDPLGGPSTPATGLAAGPGRTRAARGPQRPAPTTEVGLPRRMRRANLAPELRLDSSTAPRAPQMRSGPRSPEEIRAMMSSFQSNFGRGLADAQGSSDGDDQRKVT